MTSFNYRTYRAVVSFKNEGVVYGTETYTILATDEDQAERKARTNASASAYDDTRLPDRRISVSVEEVDEQDDIAA